MKGKINAEISDNGHGVRVEVDCRSFGSLVYLTCGILRTMHKYSKFKDDNEAFLKFVCEAYRAYEAMDRQEVSMRAPWTKG